MPCRLSAVTVAGLLATVALVACPRREEPLVLSVSWEPGTLDPHARDRVSEFGLATHLYEPLVKTDPDLSVTPALAARWTNPDDETWVFTLRDSATFHDGRRVTARDAAYSLERVRHDEALEVGVYARDVSSAVARDERTLEVRTHKPVGALLHKLASVMIVPEGSGGELARHADGSGPYRLLSYEPGRRAELARHEAFAGERPAFSRVTLLLGRTSGESLRDALDGRSHVAQVPSRASSHLLRARDSLRLARRTGVFVKYLGFDLVSPVAAHVSAPAGSEATFGRGNPFLSPLVREAIDLALDRRQLAGRLETFAVPAAQLVPPFVFGHRPGLRETALDTAGARRKLAEAGYPAGFTVTLHARRILADAGERVSEMLRAVGIESRLELLGDGEFFGLFSSPRRPSLYLTRYGCSTGDASDFLEAVIHGPDPARRLGGTNLSGYSDPELDLGIEGASRLLLPVERSESLQRLTERVLERRLLLPLYFDEDVYAVAAGLSFTPRADAYVLAWEMRRARR